MGLFDLLTGTVMDGYVEEGKANGATFVDVREVSEYKNGHVEGAVNIPVGSIRTAEGMLKDKNAKLYVYCLSGARSSRACGALKSMGYTDVTNIGGIGSYRGPVVR
ncbi:MAG: rhodanese-like domain-containing protein [Eggerthellaceae bacterium]|nr:rhodanese-like domain-containing protein [Eggerthellaceae bacterium]